MKKKKNIVGKAKRTLVLLIVVFLAAGWLVTAYALAVDRDLQAQMALVRSAEGFMEDKLYIRAANTYIEAMENYQTEYNGELELRLLDVYRQGEMWEEYANLIDNRIESGTASAEEYIWMGQRNLDDGNLNQAVNYWEQGRRAFPDQEELINLSESVRYTWSAREIGYQTVELPASDYYIPAFNGEKWGYVSESGGTLIDFQYEEATRFAGNYAVVKIDGVYTLIDKNGYWNAVDKNGLDQVTAICGTRIVGVKDGQYGIYSNTFYKISSEDYENVYINSNGTYFVRKEGRWALLNSSLEPVTDYIFTDVRPNSQGEVFYGSYGVVADEQGYYLVNPDGEAWFDTRYSDAKGIESGLVAVADSSGQWGFCDETGTLVIDCQYEDACSFSSRLGAVRYAGKWGYVNRYNTMVIGNEFESAYPFNGSRTLATDEQANYMVLTLKYYDTYMAQ